MKSGFRSLRDCVFHNPLGLSCLPSKTRQLTNWYLPRDTGIEFEIVQPDNFYNQDNYLKPIDKLGLKNIDYSYKEQAFRICSGEKGMIQLYKLSHILKKYFQLNPGSGIHYHTSCPAINTSNCSKILDNNTTGESFLKQLDCWDYKGAYNQREFRVMSKGSWINLRWDFNTVEYRIGEMTFDYDLLIKRIVHCHSITRKIENYIKLLDKKNVVPEKKPRKVRRILIGLDDTGSIDSFDY